MSENTMFVWLNFLYVTVCLAIIFAPVYLAINYSYWWLLMWLFLGVIENAKMPLKKENNEI